MFKNVRKTIWRKLSIYISYFQHPHLTEIHSLNGFWSRSLFARICWTEVKTKWSGVDRGSWSPLVLMASNPCLYSTTSPNQTPSMPPIWFQQFFNWANWTQMRKLLSYSFCSLDGWQATLKEILYNITQGFQLSIVFLFSIPLKCFILRWT